MDSTVGVSKLENLLWKQDKAWSDQYSRYVRAILGQEFIVPADDFSDAHRATDFDMVFKMRSLTFACRIRREYYAEKYPFDVTLRSVRPNGNKTELEKVLSGFGDFMFYGFAGEVPRIPRWIVLNLEQFRMSWPLMNPSREGNHDGSSQFVALNTNDLRDLGCVYSTSKNYWIEGSPLFPA